MFVFVVLMCFTLAFAQTADYQLQIASGVDATFVRWDKDGNGVMDVVELERAYAHFDADGDGKVSLHEYMSTGVMADLLFIVFRTLDYSEDGYLDRPEILGQYLVMDKNGDGIVSRSEYDKYYTDIVDRAIAKYHYLLPGNFNSSSSVSST